MKKLFPKGAVSIYLGLLAFEIFFLNSKWDTIAPNGDDLAPLVIAFISVSLSLIALAYWIVKNTDKDGELSIFKGMNKD